MPEPDGRSGSRGQVQKNTPRRRNPRLRLACQRCQRRKIRCDGGYPTCNNCKKASAVCTDGESLRIRDLRQPAEPGVQARLAWLESVVKSRLPDLDLSQAPPIDGGEDEDEVEANDSRVIGDTTQDHIDGAEIQHTNSSLNVHPTQNSQSLQGLNVSNDSLSHEIGLVSLGTDQYPRYIGPSSGYFLARVLITTSASRDERTLAHTRIGEGSTTPFPCELVEAVQAPLPLPVRAHAEQLCAAYFNAIHVQYPLLHEPTFMKMLGQMYESDDSEPVVKFQVYMVLAIGALVLSQRLKARIPGESYCLSALQHFDQLNVKNSLQGLQSLLLLAIFAIHSPCTRLNVWYLNYQCIAAVLDLGLQRNIGTNRGISFVEQELRTRVFWVVLMMDRTIATMMGRPIGLRDEACELRLPQDVDDWEISASNGSPEPLWKAASRIAFSIHLFKLVKLNSEVKYIANSIVRQAPRYAYPVIIDYQEWQSGTLEQIDQWASDIPQPTENDRYIHLVCRINYHNLRMLLLRPSPAIPNPSAEALKKCHYSACQTIGLFNQMYKDNLLLYSWLTFHSLVMSTITMLYCIKMVPDIARDTEVDVLMRDMSTSLSIISATGEHWSGAKRSRDILDDLAQSTIRRIKNIKAGEPAGNTNAQRGNFVGSLGDHISTSILPGGSEAVATNAGVAGSVCNPAFFDSMPLSHGDANGLLYSMEDPFDGLLTSGVFGDQLLNGGSSNMDSIVRSLFEDFIPAHSLFN